MNLITRYKKLNIWNKIALWGGIASIIGLILFFLPKDHKLIQSKGDFSPGVVSGEYVAGDKVFGDKFETKIEGDYIAGDKITKEESPTAFIRLSQKKKEKINRLVNELRAKYNNLNIKILINTHKNDDDTMKYLDEVKEIFESSDINVSVVPIISIGGPRSKWSMEMRYTKETKDLIKDFISCFEGFIAEDQIINMPPPLETTIDRDYNIAIIYYYAPCFDKEGGIYFKI